MGLFDKIFKANTVAFSYTPKSEQEAWIAIMYGCIAVDGEVSESEVDALLRLVVFKSLFENHDIKSSYVNALSAYKQIGSKGLIDSSSAKVGSDKATLFALVMELLLADGVLGSKEEEIAEYLTTSLSLDADLAQKIVEVMLIKNKGNIVV